MEKNTYPENLYNRNTSNLQIVNDEDFRIDILSDSLDLQGLNKKLTNTVGTELVTTRVYNEVGAWMVQPKEVPIMEISPTSDESELNERLNILKYLSRWKHSKSFKDSIHLPGSLGIPKKNNHFFSKYLREGINVSEYRCIKLLRDTFVKLDASNSKRLEEFRAQLDRVDDMLELEEQIQQHVTDLASNSGEYVGIVDVTISAKEEGYTDKYFRHIRCSNNKGVGITHISQLFSVDSYEMSPLISWLVPKKLRESYEQEMTKKIQDKFYDDRLITDVNYERINKFIVQCVGKLLDKADGKTYKIPIEVDGKIQYIETPDPLIEPSYGKYSIKRATHRGGQNLAELINRNISFSIMYHIEPHKVTLSFNGFPIQVGKEADKFMNKHGGKLSQSIKDNFEQERWKIVGMSKNYFSPIQMQIMSLFKSEGGRKFEYVERESDLSGDVFAKFLPTLSSYEPIKERLDVITEWKEYIFQNIKLLNGYIAIKNHFKPYYKKYNLTIPNLVIGGKKSLQFRNLLPLHLIDEKNSSTGLKHTIENLKPITALDSYGKNVVVLTGQNAGGKSVALETIVNTTWLAHCGLPIFGDEFTFNIRTAMGICFLSRGKGSTMQLQSKKIANILSTFRDAEDPDTCLAIIDELGTGTTENNMYDPAGGLGFGMKILRACSEYDTIISTQITSLADHAEENLDAITYMFDNEHNISAGIGRPNLNKLIQETGLHEFIG